MRHWDKWMIVCHWDKWMIVCHWDKYNLSDNMLHWDDFILTIFCWHCESTTSLSLVENMVPISPITACLLTFLSNEEGDTALCHLV